MIVVQSIALRWCCLLTCLWLLFAAGIGRDLQAQEPEAPSTSTKLPAIRISSDGKDFVIDGTDRRFVIWGVNYDHDRDGKLIEDYWASDWATVESDMAEIKALGANTVRVHLQLAKFVNAPQLANEENLHRLAELVKLAERLGLYLDITGLGCYHKQDVPDWYDSLDEAERWAVQAFFWESVAKVCNESPAIFCYDLMNEPILPGDKDKATEWLAGDFAGKHFVQRITLDLNGRTREVVAKQWIETMVSAIRKEDSRALITVGVIPWAMVWPSAKPIFYSPEANEKLDFVSVHIYPESGQQDKARHAIQVHDIGKPIVIEETFPLKCSAEELSQFMEQSKDQSDGWISFYWGETIEELSTPPGTIAKSITSKWLEAFTKARPVEAN